MSFLWMSELLLYFIDLLHSYSLTYKFSFSRAFVSTAVNKGPFVVGY
jgi:hypothetical protein